MSIFRVRVWDIPTRLMHWLMVLLVAGAWWTAKNDRMELHQTLGYGLLAVVSLRIYWGFFGSSTARFGQFLRGPRAIADYLKGRWLGVPGHNPLGALSVIALLVLLFAQIVLGLFAVDVDGIESGPLSTYVSFATGRWCAGLHDELFDVLLWLIGLHVAAVLFYVLVKKENLIGAMLHGKRSVDEEMPGVQTASWWRLAVGIALAGLLTFAVSRAFQLG